MLLRAGPSLAGIVTVLQQLLSVNMHVCVLLPPQFGGQAYSDVEHTSVQCRALDGIECASPRTFLRENKPCIK